VLLDYKVQMDSVRDTLVVGSCQLCVVRGGVRVRMYQCYWAAVLTCCQSWVAGQPFLFINSGVLPGCSYSCDSCGDWG